LTGPPLELIVAGADGPHERGLRLLESRRPARIPPGRGWLVRRMLLLADVVGLVGAFVLAFVLAEILRGTTGVAGVDLRHELIAFGLSLPAWIVLAKLYGLYDHDEERASHSTVDDFLGVFHLVTVGAWAFFVLANLTGLAKPELLKVAAFWGISAILVTTGRALARGWSRRQVEYLQNTIIVGAGDVGQLIARKLMKHPEYGLNLVGFVDDRPKVARDDLGHVRILGSVDELDDLVELLDVERVVFAFSNDGHQRVLELVRSLRRRDVQIDIVPRLYEIVGPRVEVHTIEGVPLFALRPASLSRSSRALKRAFDVVLATVGLVLTAPLFAVIAIAIRRDSPGPVFFRQTRLGFDMKEFSVLKFRTMRTDTDDRPHRDYIRNTMSAGTNLGSNGIYKLDRDDDVTKTGRWLRRTSLDELPQLVNVLLGQMSLVGPRPCLPYEIENFEPHHFERFLVPAGCTGLWQVTARANASFGEALEMDVEYARGWSIGLDLRLLCRTPFELLRQRRATA
jgi:exopolysaccharide biosynthesis polyprenyl glycosylphosphotransferase